MARVRFLADFDYKPTRSTTIAYKAGMELTVRRECADQAIAKGKAKEIGVRSQTGADQAEIEGDDGDRG